MKFSLMDIPGIPTDGKWLVKALAVDDRDPEVLFHLEQWSRDEKANYKKIMKVMKIVAMLPKVTNPKHVKRSGKFDGVYEMRAHTGHARVFFFYDINNRTAVCTNILWKGSASKQNMAFALCDRLRALYLESQ